MVRYEDPPGGVKHLRFGSPDHVSRIKEFPGVKAIVLHKMGKAGEHPHLHVWWEGDVVTNQTIRNHLKKFDDVFKSYKSQNDWSFRNHDSWETWAAYVTKNPSHEVLVSYLDLDEVSKKASLVVPKASVTTYTVTTRVRKPTAEERLMNYCERELHWVKGEQFSDVKIDMVVDQCRRAVIDYSNGRLHNNQLIAMTRNVMYVYGDLSVKNHLRDILGANLQIL